ncbi:MAG: TRAP transporter substrate-binding protein DctP, partial [SAR324 cluster bacterium]|nr:TRAP transporter substrate-binding protein DctP [SAR324 cluster bacterium]
MTQKQLFVSVIGFCMLLGSALIPNSIYAEEIVLKVSSHLPVRHRLIQDAYSAYTKEIEKRTNGKVKFKWYHAGSLAQAGQTYQAVQSGLVDMVMPFVLWVYESRYPVNKVMHLPFLYDSPLHGARVFQKAYQVIPEMRKELSDVKVIGFATTGTSNILTTKRAIRKMSDLKGLKLWGGSKMSMSMARSLGASPTVFKLQDVYMSLQRGMIQGAIFPTAPARSYKLVEVVRNYLVLDAIAGLQPLVMNLKKWNSLPPDV